MRSLGGLNTGLVYDGITIADAQTGQVDLSKFSATFVQSLELDQANPQQIPLPARIYSSASILSFTSNSFNTTNFSKTKWLAGMNAGSFGLWQPYAGVYVPVGKNMVVSANAQATWAEGDYPYQIENGMFSQKAISHQFRYPGVSGRNKYSKSFFGQFHFTNEDLGLSVRKRTTRKHHFFQRYISATSGGQEFFYPKPLPEKIK